MKKSLLIGILVLAAVAIIGSAVYAQTPTPPVPQPGSGLGQGMMAGRGGMAGGMAGGMRGGMWNNNQAAPSQRTEWTGYSGPLHDLMVSAYAGKLGISVDDLNKALASGKTMAQVALDKGIPAEQFTKLMNEAHDQALAEAVKKGLITQEQATWMEQRQEQMPNGMGPGGCWGTTDEQPAAPGTFAPRRGGMRGPAVNPTAVPAPKS